MSRSRPRSVVVIATCLGFAVVQLDVSVVNIALRPVGSDLGGGVSGLQWIVTAYTITFAALILSAGALGDRIGARRVFTAGFTVFTVASVGCGAAPGLGALIAARAIQGVGAALLVPCSLALLTHAHPEPSVRARAVGLWAAGASVALSGGPLVGGLLIALFGWRAIFLINLPLGVSGIVLTLRHLPETPRAAREFDLPGQLASVIALGALATAIIEGGAHGFTVTVGVAAVVALAGAIAFVRCERRPRAMLPLALFRVPAFRVSVLVGLLINVAFYGLIFVLSLYFQRVHGWTPLQAGLAFAPMTAIVLCVNLIGARLGADLRGALRAIAAGAGLLVAGTSGLLGAGAGTPYLAIVVPLIAVGGGIGLIVPVITSCLLGSVEASFAGTAAGTLNTARQAGSVLGVAVFGALAAASGGVVGGLHAALLISAGLGLTVIVLAAGLRRAARTAPSAATSPTAGARH
ncbi:MAG TPA: MFS transporter [Solirubrobacteraceae bacterium]|nr:MFS transporter [Solirubrobacteraceae bacterium]